MSDEDLRRHVETLIEWQANFSLKMDELRESHAATDRTVQALSQVSLELYKQNTNMRQYLDLWEARLGRVEDRTDLHEAELEIQTDTLVQLREQLRTDNAEIRRRLDAIESNGSK